MESLHLFFDGWILHSGDIPQPQRLIADPLTGRLTFNGFFTSRRHLK
jgi:hypothetical protein